MTKQSRNHRFPGRVYLFPPVRDIISTFELGIAKYTGSISLIPVLELEKPLTHAPLNFSSPTQFLVCVPRFKSVCAVRLLWRLRNETGFFFGLFFEEGAIYFIKKMRSGYILRITLAQNKSKNKCCKHFPVFFSWNAHRVLSCFLLLGQRKFLSGAVEFGKVCSSKFPGRVSSPNWPSFSWTWHWPHVPGVFCLFSIYRK